MDSAGHKHCRDHLYRSKLHEISALLLPRRLFALAVRVKREDPAHPTMMNVRVCAGLVSALFVTQAFPSDFRIDSWNRQGSISWTNAFPSGVCSVETTTLLTNPRTSPCALPQNYFTTTAPA